MANRRTLAVTLSLSGEPPTTGEITVEERALPARIGRGLLTMLVLWVIGAMFIIIPAVHFVVPPSMFVAGIVMAIVRSRETQTLVKASGLCPRCKVSREFAAGGGYREGRKIHCEGCGSQIEVHAA